MTTYFSVGTAIFLTLLAAGMWGSWMQVVKHLKGFPIEGLVFYLYTFSVVLVWGVTLILAPTLIPEGIAAATAAIEPMVLLKIMGGGLMMAVGMFFSLTVLSKVGLLLGTAISGIISSILGIVVSIAEEGMPASDNALLLLISCIVVFIVAGLVCNYASTMRDHDKAEAEGRAKEKQKSPLTFKIIMMIIINSVLVTGWSIGTAAGTANAVPAILTCAYLCTGSFIGAAAVAVYLFTKKKEWKTVLCIGTSKKPMLLGVIAACCHYGGNLISIYSMPVISATLSFLFGRTSTVWTYFWGLFYGEFAGSKTRTKIVLAVGILLFFAAVGLLGMFNYS